MRASVNRRKVLAGAAGLAAASVMPRAWATLAPSAVTADCTLLAGGGGNVLVVATSDGVVLVDSGAAEYATELLPAVAAITSGARIRTLFNTHWHLDQIGANELIGKAGAAIVAHKKRACISPRPTTCRLRTVINPRCPRRHSPRRLSTRRARRFSAGQRIEYGHLLEAHTDGDAYVYFRDANVLAVGDAVSPERDPVLDWFGGGWLGGRIDSLRLLLEISNAQTKFVPSYGAWWAARKYRPSTTLCCGCSNASSTGSATAKAAKTCLPPASWKAPAAFGAIGKVRARCPQRLLGPPQHAVARHQLRTLALASWLLAAGLTGAAEPRLVDLIQNGDRDAALARIAEGADVNEPQGDGTTPLHWAVYNVDANIVAALLEAGAKADVANDFGSSPLGEAVKLGDLGLVRALLDAGADVESPNGDGQTALMLAASSGALDVARLLVERGADVNAAEAWRGQTSLMWAVDGSYAELAQFLIDRGANVYARAFKNDWDSQITSEPRAQYRPTGGLTPLLYAARSGCTRCVRSLLAAGANVDQPNPDGITPLMTAIDNFRYDTARALLDAGANPHLWDWWGRTALYVAVDMSTYTGRPANSATSAETSAVDVMRVLLGAGVDPEPQLNMHLPARGGNSSKDVDDLLTTGATPLLRAAIGHDATAAKLLLEHGASIDLPNVMGVTPLMAAAGMGVAPRDSRFSARGDVQTRAIEMLDVLLDAGANIDARVEDTGSRTARIARPSSMTERQGQTALFGAVRFGWRRVVDSYSTAAPTPRSPTHSVKPPSTPRSAARAMACRRRSRRCCRAGTERAADHLGAVASDDKFCGHATVAR